MKDHAGAVTQYRDKFTTTQRTIYPRTRITSAICENQFAFLIKQEIELDLCGREYSIFNFYNVHYRRIKY